MLNTFDGNYWDRYEGYDLNRDGVGDVPFRPVSLYAVVVERMPFGPVSYTHLRAHETVLDLVCRLLLEKKEI